MKLSEPDYLQPSEYAFFRVSFNNVRSYYQTTTALDNGTFSVPVPMLTTRQVAYNDPIGTGSLGSLDPAQVHINNKTWTFVMNSVGTSTEGPEKQTVQLFAAQCPFDGCIHPKVSVLPATYSPWSSASTWPSGVVPQPGDDVLIANDMAVEMDVSPPLLGDLRIEGALRFKPDSAKALQATSIAVFGCVLP